MLHDVTADDLDDLMDVRSRSFGNMTGDRHEWRRTALEFAAAGRYLGAYDGQRLVAAARIWDFGQWWHGRRVPMAGIASVVVAPEYRGSGTASLLMRAVMERSRSLGFPLTALYPATVAFYRKLGYEYAGARHRYTFDAAGLRSLGHGNEVAIRRGGPGDAAKLLELVARVRTDGRESGPLVWPVERVQEWLAKEETFCYLADDGFVVYGWHGRELRVDEHVAASGETARALWATVGSGASIAKQVEAHLSPDDPVHLLVPAEASHETYVERWMLRLLDAPAAIAARGWAPGVDADIPLTIEDAEISANSGTWQLQVKGGEGSLTPAASGGLVLTSRGLAALYAGTPVASLRIAGIASGGSPTEDGLLDTVFAGSTAFLLDYF